MKSPRTRAKIIAELASLPSAIQGKICEDRRILANGTTAVYHKNRMKYDEYRENGWFYGSGAMESGCKTVVGQRFKQSGMIWSLNGSKALLAIRTLYKSNRLEEFFNYLVADLPQVVCAA